MQAIADQASIAVFNARLYNELQNAHQRYRELFEESIDPIFITDWDGRILEANREAIPIFLGDGRDDFDHPAHLVGQVRGHEIHVVSQALPRFRLRQTPELARPACLRYRPRGPLAA